jgi:hypothetical protein
VPDAQSRALVNYSGWIICVACRNVFKAREDKQRVRRCARGLHVMPKGTRRCQPCASTRVRAGDLVYSYLHQGFPPDEILRAAACRITDAFLFDPREQHERRLASEDRHRRAVAICRACPVWELCRADAIANTRSGVFGGLLYLNGHRAMPHGNSALVRSVQGVPESPSCETSTA